MGEFIINDMEDFMEEKTIRGWLRGDIETGRNIGGKNDIKKNMLRAATWITNVVIDYENEDRQSDSRITKSDCVCKRGINNKLMELEKKYFIFVRFEEGVGHLDLSIEVLQKISQIIGEYNLNKMSAEDCLKEINKELKEKQYFKIYFSDDYKTIYETARKESKGNNINLNTEYAKKIIERYIIKFD